MNTQQRFMLGVAAGAAAGFAISDALPGLTVSAERAARQIIDACWYGDPQLTISLPAQDRDGGLGVDARCPGTHARSGRAPASRAC